jgi:hypothetical protein
LACFIAAAVVAALQWVPFTGIFLMFLMAPLWSVVLINAGFLAMIFEATMEMVPRWAIVIPVVYFGGYYAEAVLQHLEVSREIATLESNPADRLKFDANDAVINVDLLGDEIGHDLIAFYHVPAVIRGGIGQDGLADVYRLKPECKLAWEGSSSTPSRNEFLRRSLNFDPCIAKHREVYSGPIVNIKSAEYGEKVTDTVEADRIVLTSPDRNQVTIDNGWYSPLSWFPTPIIGCGLNDEPPAWKCVAHFNHDRIPVLTPIDGVSGPAAAVARVLGLERKA